MRYTLLLPTFVGHCAMAERRSRRPTRAGTSRVAGVLASVVRAIAVVFAAILVVHIVLTMGSANPDNGITKRIADVARPLALGFKDLFAPSDPKTVVLVNFGLAAIFWLVVGAVLAWLIRRLVR